MFFRRLRRPVTIEKGGMWLPLWFKKWHAVQRRGTSEWVFPARYARNQHLVPYDQMDGPQAVTRNIYLTLCFKLAILLAAMVLSIKVGGSVILMLAAAGLVGIVATTWRRARRDFIQYVMGFLSAGRLTLATAAALLIFKQGQFPFVASGIAVAFWLYLRWAASVVVIQKTGFTKYRKVIAVSATPTEATDIDEIKPFWLISETLSAIMDVGSQRVWAKDRWVWIGPMNRNVIVGEILLGVYLSVSESTLRAAEQQTAATYQDAVLAFKAGLLDQETLVTIHGREAAEQIIKIALLTGSRRKPSTRTEPADETPTEPIPTVGDDKPDGPAGPPTPAKEPVVYVAGTGSGPVGTLLAPAKAPATGWKLWWHRMAHTPHIRKHATSGEDEYYCPQCGAVYPDKK